MWQQGGSRIWAWQPSGRGTESSGLVVDDTTDECEARVLLNRSARLGVSGCRRWTVSRVRLDPPGSSYHAQGVRPIESVDELAFPGVWESDQELDEFLADLYASRRASLPFLDK